MNSCPTRWASVIPSSVCSAHEAAGLELGVGEELGGADVGGGAGDVEPEGDGGFVPPAPQAAASSASATEAAAVRRVIVMRR